MIYRIRHTTDEYQYLVSNSLLKGDKPEGTQLLSGVLMREQEALKYMKVASDEEQVAREITVAVAKQMNSQGEIVWIKLKHADVADMLPLTGGVEDQNSKINASTVYLAGTDANKYVEVLKSIGIDYNVETPIDPETKEVKTVEFSRINQFPAYRTDKLLRSYYIGREFIHEEKGYSARITNIQHRGRKATEFVTLVGEREHNPILPLDTFAERYKPVLAPGEENLERHIDLARYAHIGVHKLIPEPSDTEYLDAVLNVTDTLVKEKKDMPTPSMG